MTGAFSRLFNDLRRPGPLFQTTGGYLTPDEAAMAAAKIAGPLSNYYRVEYGGYIVRLPDGTYSFTYPITDGVKDSVHPRFPIPDNTVADYHTHPYWEGSNYKTEQFSCCGFPSDQATMDSGHVINNTYVKLPAYLVTGQGQLRFAQPGQLTKQNPYGTFVGRW